MAQNNCTPVYKRTVIDVTDPRYFCNKSWTISYNMNTQSWISFHSYIPNFYIGENNFFYSGLNGCCDDIDAIAVNELPPTLTTTTTFCWTCRETTTSTTTQYTNCTLEGNAILLDCSIVGRATLIGTTTTTTTACVRPSGLNVYTFYYGYAEIEDTIFSGSLTDACAASAYLQTILPEATLYGFSLSAENLNIGSVLYDGTGTDCTLVPNGWYLTNEGLFTGFVYQVAGGIIVSITYCASTTTTTSTSTTAAPITPTARCTAYNTNAPYGDGKYSMDRTWEDPYYEFRLDSLLLNGVEYASGQLLGIDTAVDLVVAPGVFGGTYIQNVSDWLNSIPGVNDAGFIFYDGMCTIDVPDLTSTLAIKITRTAGGASIPSSAPPPWAYWYVKSTGFTGFSTGNSSTVPSVGYTPYVCGSLLL